MSLVTRKKWLNYFDGRHAEILVWKQDTEMFYRHTLGLLVNMIIHQTQLPIHRCVDNMPTNPPLCGQHANSKTYK